MYGCYKGFDAALGFLKGVISCVSCVRLRTVMVITVEIVRLEDD